MRYRRTSVFDKSCLNKDNKILGKTSLILGTSMFHFYRCTRAGNNLADGESAVWLLKGANIKNEDIRKIYDIFMLLNDKTEADQMYPTALQKLRDVFA